MRLLSKDLDQIQVLIIMLSLEDSLTVQVMDQNLISFLIGMLSQEDILRMQVKDQDKAHFLIGMLEEEVMFGGVSLVINFP